MKLSEMNTKQFVKVVCDMTDPICRILKDDAVLEAFTSYKDRFREEQPTLEKFANLVEVFIPKLLDRHYDDTARIISIMTGKSVEEIDEQSFFVTVNDVKGFFDRDFVDFFRLSANTGLRE